MKKLLLLFIVSILGIGLNAQTYCTSVADTTASHDITMVNIAGIGGTINNSSACFSLTGSQGVASGIAGRYSDFTTATSIPVPKLRMGNVYTLYVKSKNCSTNSYGGIKMAFFDWNHDGDFLDSNEKYIINASYTTDTLNSVDVMVPYGSYVGVTRMRIVYRMTTSISSMQSCAMTTNAGETEDYNVSVLACNQQVAAIKGTSNYIYTSISPFDSTLTYTYQWKKNGVNISGATNSVYSYNTSDTGNFCVIVSANNGCTYEACTHIGGCNPSVTDKIDTLCTGTSFYFNGAYRTTSGFYMDTLVSSKGCDSFINQTLVFRTCSSPACPQFKTISYTKSGSVFYFTSSGPSSIPYPFTVRYNWTFSNGMTSTQKNPIITSLPAGYNWAKLSVCIDSGTTTICCDSSFRDSIMNINCQMYCTITKVGDSLKVLATGGTTPRTYMWNSGISGEKIKAVNAGTYTVTVMDATGCTSTCSYTVTVSSNPCSAYKYFYFTTNGQVVNFTPYTPSGSNYYVSYYWDFGDGGTSNSASPSHTYSTGGTYTAKMKFCLRDSAQNLICCDSFNKTVAVYNSVPCNIGANFGYYYTSGGSVQFIDSTTPAGTYTYYWSFGDSTFSTAKNPYKTYTANGTKTVCLIVTKWLNSNNQVCRDTVCKTVSISNVNPCNRFVPNFTWSVTSSGAYQFSNTTNLTNFNIVSTSFVVSNGTTYNYNNPSHTFTSNGYYSVTMTMTVYDVLSGTNCTKTISKYIYVNTSLCGCFKAYNTYTKSGMTVQFNNTSTCTDSATTYLYKFGNGNTSTSPSPSHTYTLPGLYRTVMYISKTVGSTTCYDSFVRIIQITTSNPCKDSGYTTYYNYSCGDYIYPVCGCDSITYRNSCLAMKAGVKQYSQGPCANDTSFVKICGYVYRDLDKDCAIDSIDMPMGYITIKFNTTPARYVYTNAAGYYQIYLPKGTYQVSQLLSNSYFPTNQICPTANAPITVAATTGGTTYCNNNFFDTTNTCPDLATNIHRVNRITPGFVSRKAIKFENRGATPITGVVLKYRFLSALTVLSSTSASYSVSGNVITWNIGTIPAYTTGYKYAHFSTPTTLALGTAVIDSVWIEPMNADCNTANNHATYNDTCVGSYDPNDKSAYPANEMDTTVKSLDYLVRFQNTGTAPAHNVVIEDQIDANFDRSSLVVNSTSHNMNLSYNDDGKLYFEFANIMLPDSGTDYEASQGFVAYSIKLKNNLAVGTKLKNTANIYFDFNDPIVTNTTVNTIILKSSAAITNLGKDMNISIYPNPTQDKALIKITLDKPSIVTYNLFDLNGKLIQQKNNQKTTVHEFTDEIILDGLHSGIYLLNININGEESSFKLIKE